MFWIIVIIGVVFAILYGALRIILRWILPATTFEKFDYIVDRTVALCWKLLVVALAGLIIFFIILAMMIK